VDADGAKKILSLCSALQSGADDGGFGATAREAEPIALFDRLITHPKIVDAGRSLFLDGYYALAVEECFKCLNSEVKNRAGLDDDGVPLMQKTFTPKGAILRFNDRQTESERNEQGGYMNILAGCMQGIRNPRAHTHKYDDAPDRALEMICWANHLMTKIEAAVKTP